MAKQRLQYGLFETLEDGSCDDLIVNGPHRRVTWWDRTVDRELIHRKLYGNDSFLMNRYVEDLDEDLEDETDPEDEALVYEEGKQYSKWELEQLADQLLREDSKRELCRRCGKYGEETGHVESQPQVHEDDGSPLVDETGAQLYVDFPELRCENGHIWYKGEGKRRGNDGENPILFAEHLKNRQKREIYTTVGTPDPKIVAGMFNRTHPQGRKVNSEDQRKKHGASFYR